MVNLLLQHKKIDQSLIAAIQQVIASSNFIKGTEVVIFEEQLAGYLHINHVIGCANGTDALQIALMSLSLLPGDEIIVPAFTYVATIEVIALLKLVPVIVDVEEGTYNISVSAIAEAITSRTRAIIPVHLFGQCANMEPLLILAKEHNLFVIEDNAQSLGSSYIFSNGKTKMAGTMGHIGCTSFFPTKNLGCMGDGGALMTDDPTLAERIRMVANHGQEKKYIHKIVGCNSRLDTIQAAILNVKLPYLDAYLKARKIAADFYLNHLSDCHFISLPEILSCSPSTFNQFTTKVKNGLRDQLRDFLTKKGIPSMVYYPMPIYKQPAFKQYVPAHFSLPVTEILCESVLSIPIHTELTEEQLFYISETILNFKWF